MSDRSQFKLGDRVKIVDGDVYGVLVERRDFLDGSLRWQVDYWHDGKRQEITVMEREIEMDERKRS